MSKKKGKKGRTLAVWLQQLILQPEQVERSVIAELVMLSSRLGVGRINITFDLRDEDWLRQHRKQVEIYLVWLGVLEQLLQGIPLEEITVPESLPVPGVSEPKVSPAPGPWVDFGLTATQWLDSIHDVLMRSAVAGSVAASGAISKAGINTVGGFYVIWGGDDEKISSGIIRNFGLARLQIVKQALKEAKIPWPKAQTTTAVPDPSGDKPWEGFNLTEAQWGMPLTDVLVGDSRGNTHQPSRVRNILAKAGCATVGELYLFCQGRKRALLELSGMSETRLIILDNAMRTAGIPLLSQ